MMKLLVALVLVAASSCLYPVKLTPACEAQISACLKNCPASPGGVTNLDNDQRTACEKACESQCQ